MTMPAAGSHLFSAGTHVAAVSAILGHSSMSLTLQTYTQALPTGMRAAVERRRVGAAPVAKELTPRTNTQRAEGRAVG